MFKKLVNVVYYSPYKDSEIYFVNLTNSKIYVLSPALKSDLDQLSSGCEIDSIDADLLKFLFDEELICTIRK